MLQNLVRFIQRHGYEVTAFNESRITVNMRGNPLSIPATYDEVMALLGCD